MQSMKYVCLVNETNVQFIEIPESYAYQLTALHHRLHKEISKLTAANIPSLPHAIAECESLELTSNRGVIVPSLEYIQQLEQQFASIQEEAYPLISLLTEIRALQAQLEQWYEEEA